MMPSFTNCVPTNSAPWNRGSWKKLQANEDQITEDDFGTEQSCSSIIQGSSKRTSLRSRTTNDSIAKCFFCDSSDGTLHKVLTFQPEKRVRKCAKILEDNALLGKLSAQDVIALDAIYHSTCLLNLYRECNQKETEVTYDDTNKKFMGIFLVSLQSIWNKLQRMTKKKKTMYSS